ncbi:MAG: hypothetical protein WCT27_02345 [Patescibacteria group bacterium]|jgi:dihydroorotate dehydrogenase
MIALGRIPLANPIIAASGALGFGRGYWWDRPLVYAGIIKPDTIGAVITKTLTSQAWTGNWKGWNPWQVLWPLCGGWVNAFGLTNRGLRWFIEQEYPRVHARNLIVSINDPEPSAIPRMAEKLNRIELLAIEVNLSCPNTPQWTDLQRSYDVTKMILYRIKSMSRHPLVIKIGYLNERERENIAEICQSVGIDAVDMINTIPFGSRFPGQMSPLKNVGGVSGPLISRFALEQVDWFARNTRIPIIGGGGAGSADDVRVFLNAGATAVSIGSAHIMRPWISSRLATLYA